MTDPYGYGSCEGNTNSYNSYNSYNAYNINMSSNISYGNNNLHSYLDKYM